MSSDRGYGQLYLHLLFPYTAAWEAREYRGASGSGVAGMLSWGQIVVYDLALSVAWIRNRLRFTAIVLAIIHLLAIAFSIQAIFLKR